MDSITPEVDAFCCKVARNVNSLLFRKSWINFSFRWGAAWISLSTSEFYWKEEGKGGDSTASKNSKSEGFRLHFSFSLAHRYFSFLSHLPHVTAAFIQCKSPKYHLCQRAHLSLRQVHNWPVTNFLTEFLTGCWAIQGCCEQIKQLLIRFPAVR